jgi:hypothetical protein
MTDAAEPPQVADSSGREGRRARSVSSPTGSRTCSSRGSPCRSRSGGGERTDQNGAFQTIAAQPFGQVLLWVLVSGSCGRAVAAGAGDLRHAGAGQSEQIKKRVENGARAVVFAALAVCCPSTAGRGAGHRAGGAAGVLGWPAASSSSARSGSVLSPSRW